MLSTLRYIYHKYNLKKKILARILAFIINYSVWKIVDFYHIARINLYHIFIYIRIINFNIKLSSYKILFSIYKIYQKTGFKEINSKKLEMKEFNMKIFKMNFLKNKNRKSKKHIKKYAEINSENNKLTNKKILSDMVEYEVDSCNLLNSKLPGYMSNKVKFINPRIYKYTAHDVTLIGQSDIVGKKGDFFHLLYKDFTHVKISEELHRQVYYVKLFFGLGYRLVLISQSKNYLKHFENDQKYYSMIGSTTSNYAHWLTEHLPKLLFIDDEEFCLVIDSFIHENLKNTIYYILKNKKVNIIELPPHKRYSFKELNFVDLQIQVPFQFRDVIKSPIRENDTVFNKIALLKLRKNCLSNVVHKKQKKIFIIRESVYRDFVNQDEVSNYFLKNNFELVDPSNYSFSEQVEIFSSATHIAGQSGAGFANMIFAHSSCKLLMFATNMLGGNYRYYSNIASIIGQKLYYFKCINVENNANIHSDIYVDVGILKNKLNEIEFFQ